MTYMLSCNHLGSVEGITSREDIFFAEKRQQMVKKTVSTAHTYSIYFQFGSRTYMYSVLERSTDSLISLFAYFTGDVNLKKDTNALVYHFFGWACRLCLNFLWRPGIFHVFSETRVIVMCMWFENTMTHSFRSSLLKFTEICSRKSSAILPSLT